MRHKDLAESHAFYVRCDFTIHISRPFYVTKTKVVNVNNTTLRLAEDGELRHASSCQGVGPQTPCEYSY